MGIDMIRYTGTYAAGSWGDLTTCRGRCAEPEANQRPDDLVRQPLRSRLELLPRSTLNRDVESGYEFHARDDRRRNKGGGSFSPSRLDDEWDGRRYHQPEDLGVVWKFNAEDFGVCSNDLDDLLPVLGRHFYLLAQIPNCRVVPATSGCGVRH